MRIRFVPPLKTLRNTLYLAPAQSFSFRSFTNSSQHLFRSTLPKMDVSTQVTSHNQYHSSGLDFHDLSPSPTKQFDQWFKAAIDSGVAEPEAMTLSTCSIQLDSDNKFISAKPSSRMVLLKKVDSKGFLFYSNYTSRKGMEIGKNPHASATFYWREQHKSVRISGKVVRITEKESEEYFQSRPLGSRIGARASPQSKTVQSRQELEDRVREEERKWKVEGAAGLDGEERKYQEDRERVPLPDYWGGYRIIPEEVEFWVGRENRLHDRFRYTRDPSSTKDANEDNWQIDRLGP